MHRPDKGFSFKFSKPGQLAQYPFVGTLSTFKAFLLVEKHRHFVGCDTDIRCLEKLMPSLTEAYVSQLLNQASD